MNDPYVVDENANVCSAVHELALPRLRDRVELIPPTRYPAFPDIEIEPFVPRVVVEIDCSEPVPPTVYTTPLADRFERLVMF